MNRSNNNRKSLFIYVCMFCPSPSNATFNWLKKKNKATNMKHYLDQVTTEIQTSDQVALIIWSLYSVTVIIVVVVVVCIAPLEIWPNYPARTRCFCVPNFISLSNIIQFYMIYLSMANKMLSYNILYTI